MDEPAQLHNTGDYFCLYKFCRGFCRSELQSAYSLQSAFDTAHCQSGSGPGPEPRTHHTLAAHLHSEWAAETSPHINPSVTSPQEPRASIFSHNINTERKKPDECEPRRSLTRIHRGRRLQRRDVSSSAQEQQPRKNQQHVESNEEVLMTLTLPGHSPPPTHLHKIKAESSLRQLRLFLFDSGSQRG